MPGTKTSVWLGEEQHEQWKASGKSLTEIVKAGLAALGLDAPDTGRPATLAEIREELDDALMGVMFEKRLGRIVREELSRVAGESHA